MNIGGAVKRPASATDLDEQQAKRQEHDVTPTFDTVTTALDNQRQAIGNAPLRVGGPTQHGDTRHISDRHLPGTFDPVGQNVNEVRIAAYLMPPGQIHLGERELQELAQHVYEPTREELENVSSNPSPVTLHNTKAMFRGAARMHEALRHVSSLAMWLNKESFIESGKNPGVKTPEVQSCMAGRHLFVATNAKDDALFEAKLKSFFKDGAAQRAVLGRIDAAMAEKVAALDGFPDEIEPGTKQAADYVELANDLYVLEQQKRHIEHLIKLASDPDARSAELTRMRREMIAKGEDPQVVESMCKMMGNFHLALADPSRVIVPGGVDQTLFPGNSKVSQHCEQRILEYIQQRLEGKGGYLEMLKEEYPGMNMFLLALGGTKPPCGVCIHTEEERDVLARSRLKQQTVFMNNGAGRRPPIVVYLRAESPEYRHGNVYGDWPHDLRCLINSGDPKIARRVVDGLRTFYGGKMAPGTHLPNTAKRPDTPDPERERPSFHTPYFQKANDLVQASLAPPSEQ